MEFLPLQLKLHYFTKVMVEADPCFQPKDDEDQLLGVNTQVEVKQHKEDPRRWQVILNIRTEAPEGQTIPYKVDLQAVGLFAVAPEVEEAMMPKLVRVNGSAILYSSAREFLLTITGRGPWPPVYLPTTNFLGPLKPKAEQEAQLSAPAPKAVKKKRISRAKKVLDQLEGATSES
jgi:preprotein translocase subunit SecB